MCKSTTLYVFNNDEAHKTQLPVESDRMSQREIQILFVAHENTVQGRVAPGDSAVIPCNQVLQMRACLSCSMHWTEESTGEHMHMYKSDLPVCSLWVSLTPAEILVFADLQTVRFGDAGAQRT